MTIRTGNEGRGTKCGCIGWVNRRGIRVRIRLFHGGGSRTQAHSGELVRGGEQSLFGGESPFIQQDFIYFLFALPMYDRS
jgi:hypothetical protein